MEIINQLTSIGLLVGVVVAEDVEVAPSPPPFEELIGELVNLRQQQDFPPADLKKQVRDLLRKGGFKPAGRSKPASEYLAAAAREARFPLINNLVDANNYLSLKTGLPISLLDGDVVGDTLLVRLGASEESYVFNTVGHEINLQGLICVCRALPAPGKPLGNPVKDSMEGKISEQTRRVVGVIYAPQSCYTPAEIKALTAEFAHLLTSFANAQKVGILTA